MAVLAKPARQSKHLLGWILSALLVCPSTGSAKTVDEYGLKAAFLYSFLKFVEWPATTGSGTFTICIFGDDPFGSSIDTLVKEKVVNDRKVEVRRLKEAEEAKQCQIVFIRSGQKGKAMQLIEAVKGLPVLTVGEQHDFGKLGGLVYLTMADDQVNISINGPGAVSAGLKVSAKLMSLANGSRDSER